MAAPPAQPMETTSPAVATTVDSLKDDNIEDILLRLPSPASLARAALSSSRWRRVASSPDFLRRFRERRPSPPVLGLFSTIPLPLPLGILWTDPLRPRPVYAIGDTEAGECCLVSILCRAMLQVWLLKKKKNTANAWELERQSQIGGFSGFSVHMVSAGLALVFCIASKYSHILIDLKNLSLKDKFLCHRSMAYPLQMPWPPAGLLATSTRERSKPQTHDCRDAENQQEAPSSSRKHKRKDGVSSGKETMGSSISVASLEDEPSEKKFSYETGPP
uniref:Uncharacterized protein n=1 Tax=Avena sativa TaxID=4498 RepID=A0ACD5W7D9_AVESA